VTARGALEVAALAARHLERLGIPYVVVGSVASALHGEPRATLDVDLTLRMRSSDVNPLCEALAEEVFVDPAAMRESVRTGIACNAIHRASHVLGVLKARGPELERDYLDDRALELGVADLLRKSLREAGLG